MIGIKQDVDVRGLHPIMWDLIYDIEPLYEAEDLVLILTAALDGKHSYGSFHYLGLAIDIRTRTLSDPDDMFEKIKRKISPAFDVILHKTHMHIEYQPKTQDERIKR